MYESIFGIFWKFMEIKVCKYTWDFFGKFREINV
jgi:hypothetical protein